MLTVTVTNKLIEATLPLQGSNLREGVQKVLRWDLDTQYLGESNKTLNWPSLDQQERSGVTAGNRLCKRIERAGVCRLEIWDTNRLSEQDKPIFTIQHQNMFGYLSPDGRRLLVFRPASRATPTTRNGRDLATLYCTDTGRPLLELDWKASTRFRDEVGAWSDDGQHFWTEVTTEGKLQGFDFRPMDTVQP